MPTAVEAPGEAPNNAATLPSEETTISVPNLLGGRDFEKWQVGYHIMKSIIAVA